MAWRNRKCAMAIGQRAGVATVESTASAHLDSASVSEGQDLLGGFHADDACSARTSQLAWHLCRARSPDRGSVSRLPLGACQVLELHANGACYPFTPTLCADHATDYAVRVRNDSDRPVTVRPWREAAGTSVQAHEDRIVPTDGYPPPPWRIVVRWQADDQVLLDRTLRGTQDEFGPPKAPFPRVFSFYVGVQEEGSVIVCPGNCAQG